MEGHSYSSIIAKDQARVHNGNVYVQRSVNIFAVADSAAHLIGTLSDTLGTVNEVRHKTDLEFLSAPLVAQLTVWQAAITKVREWAEMEVEEEEQSHGLLGSLDSVLTICHGLVIKMGDVLCDIQKISVEAGTVTENEDVKEAILEIGGLRREIELQTNSLNLLLGSCNSQTLQFLRRRKLRKPAAKVKKDSESSLIAQRDQQSSFRSLFTDRGSKLSVVFDFDSILCATKVYTSLTRNFIKRAVRNEIRVSPSLSLSSRGDEETRKLQTTRRERPESWNILLGTSSSDRARLMTLLAISYCEPGQLGRYRPAIYETLIHYMELFINTLPGHCLEFASGTIRDISQTILDYNALTEPLQSLDERFTAALTALWELPDFHAALEQYDCLFPEPASYFFRESRRMITFDYLPTEVDVVHALARVDPPPEIKIKMSSRDLYYADFGSQQSGLAEWYCSFPGVESVIYCVNLAEYDQVEAGLERNLLAASLELFGSITNYLWFGWTPTIVLFTHVCEFQSKLATSPLERHFPGFSGGNDAQAGANYILREFRKVARSGLEVYAHTFDLSTTKDVPKIFDTLEEATKRGLETMVGY